MLDGHRHALQSDALGATEGMTACAECHLLDEVGVIGRYLGQLLLVEGHEDSLVVGVETHEIAKGVERIGFLLSGLFMHQLVTTTHIVDFTGGEHTGSTLGGKSVYRVSLVEGIVVGVVVLALGVGELVVERGAHLHRTVEGVGEFNLEEATGGLHIGVAILGQVLVVGGYLDEHVVERHIGVGLEGQLGTTADDASLEVGHRLPLILVDGVDIHYGHTHDVEVLKVDEFVEGLQRVGVDLKARLIAHALGAAQVTAHLFQIELDGNIGIKLDVILVKVLDGWSIGILCILEGIADDGEGLDCLLSGISKLYIPKLASLANIGIAVAGHGLEQGLEADDDIMHIGVGHNAKVAVALTDESGLHRAEVGLLDGL